VEHPADSLAVNIIGLFLPSHQVEARIAPELLSTGIKIPIPLPHLAAITIFRMLPV
jgi:hypothetical protein